MSRYIQNIQKNKRSLGGLILPLFFLLALGILSVGAFPGWITPVHGTPGDLCDTGAPCDAPLGAVCNVCNGEFCTLNQTTSQFQCAVVTDSGLSFSPTATPNPACPLGDPTQPGCWTTCVEVLDVNGNPGSCETPSCSPNDDFCNDISGGNESNECRAGVCLPISTPDPANPSGCDYTLTPDASLDCRNCIPEGLATLENCGNGICEPDEGEACNTCAIDCLIPGFEDACPLTTGIVIRQACQPIIPGITFDGPPYNVVGSLECEDGDLCTDNACSQTAGDVCDATPKSCSINTADFCCPADCNPPADGAICGPNDNTCDVDCYIPEECVPTPLPTPFAGCLEGSGGWSEKGGPGCGGFACSLNASASVPSHGLALALLASLGAAAFLTFRKRHG
ncbi:MAG: hypothetical protein IT572_05315 [Deltaproteobacteria bacterium]|nr:hypothetical protein [Deltaproteobacteria bacterium]